ncbi:DUF6083 domain-containing protein [Streptomyces sp. NPDC059443]|uniref:DUF6083 domain-containing protein n=1 Tax=unclassified Streptomyces TaxID=2593676 RepID=UPI0036739828
MSLGMSLCTHCERVGSARPDREPVLVGEILAGTAGVLDHAVRAARSATRARAVQAPRGTVCRTCGAAAEWHRTVRGRWLMVEPGSWPADSVPAGQRWHITDNGTVVALSAASVSGRCRISHFDVCSRAPAPTGSPLLLGLWRKNVQRGA